MRDQGMILCHHCYIAMPMSLKPATLIWSMTLFFTFTFPFDYSNPPSLSNTVTSFGNPPYQHQWFISAVFHKPLSAPGPQRHCLFGAWKGKHWNIIAPASHTIQNCRKSGRGESSRKAGNWNKKGSIFGWERHRNRRYWMHIPVVGRSGMVSSALEWSTQKGFAERIFSAGAVLCECILLTVVLHGKGLVC